MTATDERPPAAPPPPQTAARKPSTQLDLRQPLAPMTMSDKLAYADELARSGLLPTAFRGRPANVLWAIEYGAMLGLPPMAAITGIHIIEGKPTASAAIISALVRKAGHRLRTWTTYDDTGLPIGHAEIVRADDPGFTFTSTWTIERAARAGLCSLKNGRPYARSTNHPNKALSWEAYPEAMGKHRAVTEAARDACEEALCGIHYTPEELGAEVNEEGELTAYPEGSPERIADERGQAFTHAQDAADQAAGHPDDDIQDAEIVYPPQQAKLLLLAELAEIAVIRGASFADTAAPLAKRAGKKTITDLDADELALAIGSVRSIIADLLRENARTSTDADAARAMEKMARCYGHFARPRADGTYRIAPPEELLGRPPRSSVPDEVLKSVQDDPVPDHLAPVPDAEPEGEVVGHAFAEPDPAQAHADPALCGNCGREIDHPVHTPGQAQFPGLPGLADAPAGEED